MNRKIKASATVEMAMIFPMILLIVFMVLECGLYYGYSLHAKRLSQEALVIACSERDKGTDLRQAAEIADGYLSLNVFDGAGNQTEWGWNINEGFFEDSVTLWIKGSFRLFSSKEYRITEKTVFADPIRFRDRADLVYEKVKQWTEE